LPLRKSVSTTRAAQQPLAARFLGPVGKLLRTPSEHDHTSCAESYEVHPTPDFPRIYNKQDDLVSLIPYPLFAFDL
jgi:hypothetical protein